MNVKRLMEILGQTTFEFRKGEVISKKEVGAVSVTDIYMMPHVSEAPSDLKMVDVIFEVIGVDKTKAESFRKEIIDIINTYPSLDRLAGGPSYIEVGGVLGSQSAAFMLYALGEVLGLWKVITPKSLGITDEAQALELAGGGFVMISGYRPASVEA